MIYRFDTVVGDGGNTGSNPTPTLKGYRVCLGRGKMVTAMLSIPSHVIEDKGR
jgi:hypothetical protein